MREKLQKELMILLGTLPGYDMELIASERLVKAIPNHRHIERFLIAKSRYDTQRALIDFINRMLTEDGE